MEDANERMGRGGERERGRKGEWENGRMGEKVVNQSISE
jgi:hypothetical protein